MKAYRMLAWQTSPQMVEVAQPQPEYGQVLVKVAGNGLCGSDLGIQSMPGELTESLGWRVPFTLGHEIGGWVEEVGDGVTGFEPGDAVALVAQPSDGTCFYCARGHDNNCNAMHTGRGFGRDGGLAPLVLAGAERELVHLDRLDPTTVGPLTEAGTTAYHTVKRVLPRMSPGSTAVVIGAGGLGAFALQYLRVLSPARVIVVDTNPARRDLAAELGAHEIVEGVMPGGGPRIAAELRRLTAGEGADSVLDFVGNDDTIEAGMASVRRTGAFGLVGAAGGTLKKPWWRALPMDGEIFTHQGGSLADLQDVLALVETGQIQNLVELFPFSQVEEAYRQLAAGTLRGRAVVMPNRWA